jgi:glycosyltransferase involved in cell wall biosynthesis
VYNRIKELQPVLIHAHFTQCGAIVLPLVRKLKVPFVLSILGSDATSNDSYIKNQSLSGRIYLLRRKQLNHEVDQVIVPSQFLREKAVKQGFEPKKIVIIHHGVDLQQFSRQRQDVEYGHVLFVGRLIPLKGLNYLIKSMKIVMGCINNVQLTIIGDGPLRNSAELQAQNELGKGFEFLGSQPHEVVKTYMEKAYLFCVPSISLPNGQTETFGLVFAEAQAMGVPVVSSASGGIPEVVKDGETGFLVKERDVNELAVAMLKLLNDRELHDRMSLAARKRAELYFDLKKQNDELENLYERMTSEKLG